MDAPPIVIDVWDKNLNHRGVAGAPLSLTATKRANAASDCAFTLPTFVRHPVSGVMVPHPRIADLMTPGARCVVTYQPDDATEPFRLISGRVRNRAGEGPKGQATRTFTIVDDWNILHTTLGFIDPTLAADDVNQTANGAYKISGPAETVALDVIKKNYHDRLGRTITIPATVGRGGSVDLQFRMDYLADKLFPAVSDAGVIIDIGQVGAQLQVDVRQPSTFPYPLTEGSGVIVGGSFSDDDVTATRVIIGVGGSSDDIPARLFRQFTNTAAEAQIGEPLEVYVDGGSIALSDDITAQTTQMSTDAFSDNAAKVSLDITLVERGGFRYGRTFREGDIVPVQLNDSPIFTDSVREVEIVWQAGGGDGGLKVTPHVGDWQEDSDSVLINEVQRMGKALRSLQRR